VRSDTCLVQDRAGIFDPEFLPQAGRDRSPVASGTRHIGLPGDSRGARKQVVGDRRELLHPPRSEVVGAAAGVLNPSRPQLVIAWIEP
jgi:hypothetical protein